MSRNPNYGYPPGGDYRLPEREHALRHPSDDETPDDPPPRPRRPAPIWLGITMGQWITLACILGGGLITWGEMRAQAQNAGKRLDTIEAKEVEIRRSYEVLSEKLQEIKGDLKRMDERDTMFARSLDRIERHLDMISGRRTGPGGP